MSLGSIAAAALLVLPPHFPPESGWHPWYTCAPQTQGDASCYYSGAIPAPWRIYIGWACSYGTGSGAWRMSINGNQWVGSLPQSGARDFYGAASYVDAGPSSTVMLSVYGDQCTPTFRIGHES